MKAKSVIAFKIIHSLVRLLTLRYLRYPYLATAPIRAFALSIAASFFAMNKCMKRITISRAALAVAQGHDAKRRVL